MHVLSQANQIEEATNYIVELRERVENLNKRKHQLETTQNSTLDDATTNVRLPIIDVKEIGSNLEVQLVMELEHDIKLHEVIRILEEDGAEVVNAVFSTSDNKVHYTLHAKAKISRVGIDVSRVCTRLHGLK
ncbi:transcription factor bHLH167-like [Chenopodium quinoa]|uniref:transcription factor bHLH167-like n=1 Tax=Chenopodium quinoa TaxID=63459 RepID=UPI000B788C3F|nr:transcription factor bHLH167-like [Chenopodium quinoa]